MPAKRLLYYEQHQLLFSVCVTFPNQLPKYELNKMMQWKIICSFQGRLCVLVYTLFFRNHTNRTVLAAQCTFVTIRMYTSKSLCTAGTESDFNQALAVVYHSALTVNSFLHWK